MKYNDNGEYKDIYVKSFDTLPVGTEVDYDGNTVPAGWTEITDIQPSVYSTTETICGTWIDGKPLYRKVFEITSLTYNTVTNYSHGIANVSFIKPTEVYMVNTNAGQVRSINYFGGWSNNLIQTNANAISYYISDSNFNEILAIVEYTKTTD